VKDHAADYLETLGRMAELEGDAGLMTGKPRQWNRLVNRLQQVRKVLAETPEGRASIAANMADARVTVRLWAAGHALHWPESTAQARRVLSAISSDQAFGLNSMNAEMTLSEFDAGRLDPDW